MKLFLNVVSVTLLVGIVAYGFVDGECSSLSCVMNSNTLALTAGAEALALQAAFGWQMQETIQLSRVVACLDVGLALSTGMASYRVAGGLHNYLALALFSLRVAVGIQVAGATGLGRVYVGVLLLNRMCSLVYLHTYGCSHVFPELCAYAVVARLPARVELAIQFLFVATGATSTLFVTPVQRCASKLQAVFFGVAALLSGVAAVYGVVRRQPLGLPLFALSGAFDAYFARKIWLDTRGAKHIG